MSNTVSETALANVNVFRHVAMLESIKKREFTYVLANGDTLST